MLLLFKCLTAGPMFRVYLESHVMILVGALVVAAVSPVAAAAAAALVGPVTCGKDSSTSVVFALSN